VAGERVTPAQASATRPAKALLRARVGFHLGHEVAIEADTVCATPISAYDMTDPYAEGAEIELL
jgi:hypothetical protein